jgi:hypothetical protein
MILFHKHFPVLFFFFSCYTGFELRASCLLGRCSYCWCHCISLFCSILSVKTTWWIDVYLRISQPMTILLHVTLVPWRFFVVVLATFFLSVLCLYRVIQTHWENYQHNQMVLKYFVFVLLLTKFKYRKPKLHIKEATFFINFYYNFLLGYIHYMGGFIATIPIRLILYIIDIPSIVSSPEAPPQPT